MKLLHISRAFLFRSTTLGLLSLAVNGLIAQETYQFHCRDYVSTDDKRAPLSAFSYDDQANTFTIQSEGPNNIAFQMDLRKDGAYYISNQQEWFLVQGTDLENSPNQSYIWWFNGYNRNGQTPPTHSVKAPDGTTLVLWDIRRTPGINGHMDFDNPNIFISSNGQGFIHSMGLTSTTGSSTISNIGYYAKYEAAAIYPDLIMPLGYTEETLTDEIKTQLSNAIQEARKVIEADAGSTGKTEVEHAINEAQGTYDTAGKKEYKLVYEALTLLQQTVDHYKENQTTYSYKKTESGIQAQLNDLYINILFYADDIVRVVKSHAPTIGKVSLSVTDIPENNIGFELDEDETLHTVTLSTPKIKTVYHLATGQVEVLRYNGAELIREKEGGTSFFATKDGPFDSYLVSNTFLLEEDEQIYGMGQIQDGKLNRRGQTFSLAQDNKKVCIPHFQSTKNYALFWDNYSPTTFTDNTEGTRFQSTGTEIDYYVLVGDNSHDVLGNMRELTGKSPMPPLWNFGLYQSRERYVSADEVMEVVDKYRDLGVPLDCIVQDWQYWGDNAHWNALSFLNPTYSNYAEMINHVHAQNAKLMISIWANFGPQTEPYARFNSLGRLIPVESYPQNCGVRPYDVYDQKARGIYWDYLYNGLISKGIDAYWMDSSEPDYFNWKPEDLDYLSGEGRTWRALRNAFPLAHVGGVATQHKELEHQGDPYLKGKRVSILTRSAFAGQQRYGANTWSGDVVSSWENLAAQIPAACNLSVCGIPYWNSDIGGFFTGNYGDGINNPDWRRLYMRWMQFGTFTPMMRFHGTNTPREIYQFGTAGDGLGDFDQILKYVKLRYRMLPYLYSTAWQVHHADATFMRALALAFNHDPQGYDVTDEYMFGDAFLVAPVVKDATSQRDVYLPEGEKWIDFWTGESHEGGQTLTYTAHMDIIPLFVRAGSIMPWGPDVQFSTEKRWDDLEIRVYPGANGTFTLYEDENDNYNYERQKAYSEIPFTWNEETQTLTIGQREGAFTGMVETRTFRIVKVSTRRGTGDLHETRHDAVVTYDGTPMEIKLKADDQPIRLTELTGQCIQNPGFEEDGTTLNQKAPKGWEVACNTSWWGVNAGEGNGDPVATEGNYIFGVWDSSNKAQARISQTLEGLPAGTYRLTVDMQASNKNGTNRVGRQCLFADKAQAFFKDQITAVGSSDMHPLQTIALDFTVDTDNTPVTIGVETSDAPNETWFKIDNFRLYRVERPSLLLDENTAYLPTQEGLTDIDFARTLQADYWNTLCVPFTLDEAETARHFSAVKTLASVHKEGTSYTLDFKDSPCIKAGMPCLVKPKEPLTRQTFKDAWVENGIVPVIHIDGVTFRGTYSPTTLQQNEFFISQDLFYRADPPIEVKGYRAYITLDEASMHETNALHITIDGKPTGIKAVTPASSCPDGKVYDLGGRAYTRDMTKSRHPHGVYIENGKKILK